MLLSLHCRLESYIVQNIVEELWHKFRNSFLEDTKDFVGIISEWETLMSSLAMGSNNVRNHRGLGDERDG